MGKNNFDYIRFIKAFGACYKDLRELMCISQVEIDKELASEMGLGPLAKPYYISKIETGILTSGVADNVCRKACVVLKKKYKESKLIAVKSLEYKPLWIDGVIKNGIKYDQEDLIKWHDYISNLSTITNDLSMRKDYQRMHYWYVKSVWHLINETDINVTKFAEFCHCSADKIYLYLSVKGLNAKHPEDTIMSINSALKTVLKNSKKEVPNWLDTIDSGDYEKASKSIQKWYFEKLENESECWKNV